MAESLRCPSCGADIAGAIQARIESEVRGKVAAQVEVQSQAAARKALEAARAQVAIEREAERAELAAAKKERDDAQRAELDLRRREAALVKAQADVDLTVARRLAEERTTLEEAAARAADERHALALKDKDAHLEAMKRTIEELRRRSEQGSQQLQGEVLETSLEELLRREFPGDLVEPVAKGVRGADVVQRVRGAGGAAAGVILWESKRTKAWGNDWLPKLRDDQRDLKADLAALVTQVLPREAAPGVPIDGVWVTTFASALGLAHALRKGLLDVAAERRAQEGRGEKTALLYAYLSGPEFRGRIEGLVEPFRALQEDLEKERVAMERIWARRAQQIQRALRAVSGMHGDIEGIAQGALPALPALDLPGLAAGPEAGPAGPPRGH